MAKSENSKIPGPNAPKIHPITANNDPEIDPLSSYSLEKFRLYETRARYYLIGSDKNKRFFRVLKIDRMESSDLNISEDPVVYTSQEVKNLLQRIAEGNRATGGLTFVAKVYGIAGCIKFLESYYLVLVTKRRQIGCICGHAIYSIDESQILSIPHSTVQTEIAHSKTELRYKKLLSSVDLTKDFFYSYTYPIMQSLQKNASSTGEGIPYEDIFVWNAFLTQAIRSRCNNTMWTIALVHGHFKQIRLSIFGRDFSVSLVSRRSRHFAGTREGLKEEEQQTRWNRLLGILCPERLQRTIKTPLEDWRFPTTENEYPTRKNIQPLRTLNQKQRSLIENRIVHKLHLWSLWCRTNIMWGELCKLLSRICKKLGVISS